MVVRMSKIKLPGLQRREPGMARLSGMFASIAGFAIG